MQRCRGKNLKKGQSGVGWGEGGKGINSESISPPCQPIRKGERKKRGERKGVGGGWGRNNKRTRKRKYIRIIQSGKKSRWFLFLPTTKCTETRGHKRVKLPNPSHIRCTNTGQGGGQRTQAWWTGVGSRACSSRPEMHLSWDSPGTLPCPAELPTRSCPPSPHPTAKRTRANWRSGRASFLTPLASGHGEDRRELGLFGCRASPRCPLSRRRCIWGPFPPSQGWLLSSWGWVE